MPRARIASGGNLRKRVRVKSETRSGAPAGSAFSAGSTTTSSTASPTSPQPSRLRIASLGREEASRPPLDEHDHEHQDQHLPEDGAHSGFDDLVQAADPHGGEDAAQHLANPSGHHHHERVPDVVLA